ncbi:hypothetical protein HNQ80_003849 [Anaerosolibacter carboniphilus]|uniref:Uncharacterized protein n=1 Tax=Anaerosolibacter carboniphilus TaxID=1417629 RepID=A0A841KVM7_9FIRM|nr:DUF6762 family protein [Anaerosolibacter carboniphilus]MBB6217726.1 hypothetical protein [Anaerosolibacter carboniphilus]
MEALVLMLMEKDPETGVFSNEVGSYTIQEHGNLVEGIYLIHKEEQDLVFLKLTTDRDVDDWEYDAVLDYYDMDVMKETVLSIEESEGYNPVWEVSFEFMDSQDGMESLLAAILGKHRLILDEVYEAIKDKKEEYEE